MSNTKFGLLLCSGLLACSGRYVSNPSDGTDVDVGAASVTGGKSAGKGGQTGSQPSDNPPIASAGAPVSAGGSPMVGPVTPIITDTACGVRLTRGQSTCHAHAGHCQHGDVNH